MTDLDQWAMLREIEDRARAMAGRIEELEGYVDRLEAAADEHILRLAELEEGLRRIAALVSPDWAIDTESTEEAPDIARSLLGKLYMVAGETRIPVDGVTASRPVEHFEDDDV